MRLQIESTNEITTVDGQSARVWRGYSERGTIVKVLVARVVVAFDEAEEFDRELIETTPPAELREVTLRDLLSRPLGS